jgi:UDP-N-acetyl-D-mannosaminuronate dehydrogenase
LAFRGGVSDTRLSPTYDLVRKLLKLKITNIVIHDPLAKDNLLESRHKTIKITNDLDFAIKNRDLIILATDHNEYSGLSKEKTGKTPVYDGRGLLNHSSFDAGLFKGIGRPSAKQ